MPWPCASISWLKNEHNKFKIKCMVITTTSMTTVSQMKTREVQILLCSPAKIWWLSGSLSCPFVVLSRIWLFGCFLLFKFLDPETDSDFMLGRFLLVYSSCRLLVCAPTIYDVGIVDLWESLICFLMVSLFSRMELWILYRVCILGI